jgi:hypothetical protein
MTVGMAVEWNQSERNESDSLPFQVLGECDGVEVNGQFL